MWVTLQVEFAFFCSHCNRVLSVHTANGSNFFIFLILVRLLSSLDSGLLIIILSNRISNLRLEGKLVICWSIKGNVCAFADTQFPSSSPYCHLICGKQDGCCLWWVHDHEVKPGKHYWNLNVRSLLCLGLFVSFLFFFLDFIAGLAIGLAWVLWCWVRKGELRNRATIWQIGSLLALLIAH